MRAGDPLICEECGATGRFAPKWPENFVDGAKVVCQRCIENFIRSGAPSFLPGADFGKLQLRHRTVGPDGEEYPQAPDGRRIIWFKKAA